MTTILPHELRQTLDRITHLLPEGDSPLRRRSEQLARDLEGQRKVSSATHLELLDLVRELEREADRGETSGPAPPKAS